MKHIYTDVKYVVKNLHVPFRVEYSRHEIFLNSCILIDDFCTDGMITEYRFTIATVEKAELDAQM